MNILYLALSFVTGLIIFPTLFYFQKLLKLPVPDLEKETFHIHHSFYGLLLMIIGALLTFSGYQWGFHISALGAGFIVHHEVSEPGLKGIEKFIYFKKNKKSHPPLDV